MKSSSKVQTPGARFQLDSVTVRFGKNLALREIDLKIEPGEALALVGPSGAGKTTLLRLLSGMNLPSSGRVWVEGSEISALSHAQLRRQRARIAFIHQDYNLIPNLRVLHNILLGSLGRLSFGQSLRLFFFPPRSKVHEVYSILHRVGIPEKLYQRTDRLSGGQQQRTAIARALFQRPAALLADEPVSSVDPARARDTVQLLTEISREWGLTLCVSLHNLDLAQDFFPRIIGLRAGQICFDSCRSQLRSDQLRSLYQLNPEEMVGDA